MKILIVDDHALFREGLAMLLREIVSAAEIMEAGTCADALALLEANGPVDLILMDIRMPGLSGIAGIVQLRNRHAGIPVVAVSSQDDRATVLRALDAGAMGFLPKSNSKVDLARAMQLILGGGIYLPPSVFVGHAGGNGISTVDPDHGSVVPRDLGLTDRQAEVLRLILEGKSAKLICRELNISVSTVKVHTSAVLRALNVTTRTQAVVVAGRLGLTFPVKVI